MKKYVLSFLFLLVMAAAFGQKKSIVNLVSSQTVEPIKYPNGKNLIKVYKGVFKQDLSILRSDSAYFYPDQNAVDAFGHVNINQGDTLNIYSDKLNYNGNTKVAILTDNVKMVDKDATLTTNYLTYNTATRIGTYTGGGKLVNKGNTLVSKNGYYFAFTRDSYFRYNVVCTTTDAVIKTDTLRYNTGTRVTYFYGPTHIYGAKDKDTLYTEDGTYSTITEQARFGKKNLYSQGTKTLKGDSLFYDRLKGYGRAVKHITFNDNEQKTTIKGDLGEFYKADDLAVVTQNAYMIFVTEEKDSTKTDSGNKKPLLQNKGNPLKKTPLKTDSLSKKQQDSLMKKQLGLSPEVKTKAAPNTLAINDKDKLKTPAKSKDSVNKPVITKDRGHIKQDSLFMVADTLETRILTFKALKLLQQQRWNASHRDTSIKVIKTIMLTKSLKFIPLKTPQLLRDTSFYHAEFFGKPKPKPTTVKKKPVKPVDPKKLAADSIKNKRKADSLAVIASHGLSDTSRVRIISAHHHAKIFKSDLQAIADSMFYSYSDSTIRMFVNPMIWTQGSQLSGDTINLQMKNRKLDNMDMFPSAFVVNIEENDSLHFNQMGGKTMHGIFKNNKLAFMQVTGNAETIAFKRDSATHKVTEIQRSVSGSIEVNFKNSQITRLAFLIKPDNRISPFAKAKEEDKVLKGFIWKPKDRPVSKESIINSYRAGAKKPQTTKGPVKGSIPIKPASKTTGNKKQGDKASVNTPATNSPGLKASKDTAVLLKLDTLKLKKQDTLKLRKQDTLKLKKQDTLKKKPDQNTKGETAN